MKRKLFATLLSIVCLCCLTLGLTACGLSNINPNSGSGGYVHKQIGDFKFSISNDTNEVELMEYTGTSENVVIPDSVDGTPVTSIGYDVFGAYYNNELNPRNGIKIKSVVMPNTITKIAEHGLSSTTLESVTLSNNLQEIGDRAFICCYNLKNLTLPSSLKSIGKEAFADCWGIETLVIPEGVTTIKEGAFFRCSNLMQITLPSTLTGDVAFAEFENCYKLVEIINKSTATLPTFAKNVNPIRVLSSEPATSNFTNLNDCIYYQADDDVYLVNYTGDFATLVLPNEVNGNGFTVRAYAFFDCMNGSDNLDLCPVQFLDLGGATKVEKYAFDGGKLLQIIIRERMTDFPKEILKNRVAEVINLSSIEFEKDSMWWGFGYKLSYTKYLKAIPTTSNFITQDNAIFYKNADNYYLVALAQGDKENFVLPRTSFIYEVRVDLAYYNTVTIPNCVKLHQEHDDDSYKSISHIILEEGITKIPSYAFSYFWVSTITIPNSVTFIGEKAFDGNSTTIIAETGSYAQTYANENNIKFQAK